MIVLSVVIYTVGKVPSIGKPIYHILTRNCRLQDAIDGRMIEVKRAGRRRTQLLADLRNRKILGAKGGR